MADLTPITATAVEHLRRNRAVLRTTRRAVSLRLPEWFNVRQIADDDDATNEPISVIHLDRIDGPPVAAGYFIEPEGKNYRVDYLAEEAPLMTRHPEHYDECATIGTFASVDEAVVAISAHIGLKIAGWGLHLSDSTLSKAHISRRRAQARRL